jgi:hypothetical protein
MPNKKFILTTLSYALIMLILGPLFGVLHQESSKKLSNIQFSEKELLNFANKDVRSIFEVEALNKAFQPKETAEKDYLQKLDKLTLSKQIDLILNDKILRQHLLTHFRQNKALLPLPNFSETIDNQDNTVEFKNTKKIIYASFKVPEPIELSDFEVSIAKDVLARVHGHAILIGCVIPVLMCIFLWFSNQLGGAPITDRSLRVVSMTYITSSLLTITLMLLKGYSFNLGVRNGLTNFNEISEYIISSHGLKAALYGITHTVTFFSLYYFVFKVFQSLNGRAEITEDEITAKKMRMIYINGILWVAIGFILAYRGFVMFPETSSSTFFIALTLGAIIGAIKGYFVLGRTAKRNVKRISLLQKPIQYTSTIPIMLIVLIPIMIAFGVTLRKFQESIFGGAYTVGAVYVGIGSALIVASLNYWTSNLKKKV